MPALVKPHDRLMDHARYARLMISDAEPLTEREIADGWHFCPEWDGLLIGPGMDEWDDCPCGLLPREAA